jgi:hypothetical protein
VKKHLSEAEVLCSRTQRRPGRASQEACTSGDTGSSASLPQIQHQEHQAAREDHAACCCQGDVELLPGLGAVRKGIRMGAQRGVIASK